MTRGKRLTEAALLSEANEALTRLNEPEGFDFILALVELLDGGGHRVKYLRRPFQREPDFGVTSVNYDFGELLARAGEPS